MKKDKPLRKSPAKSSAAATREKPTTSSGDALDDTGEDNQRRKQRTAEAKPALRRGRAK